MKTVSLSVIYLFLVAITGCKRCERGVNFVWMSADKGDTAYIYLDDRLVFKKIFSKSYHQSLNAVRPQVKNHCSSADSIKVRAGFNNHDTLFYVDPKDVKYCYFSKTIRNRLLVNIHSLSKPYYSND